MTRNNSKKINSLTNSLLTVMMLSIVAVVIIFLVRQKSLVGPVFVILGLFHLFVLRLFGIKTKTVWPDIIFGVIDNGILVIFAIIGANIAGILGAIIGGAVGNAITDGVAGIVEGWISQDMKKHGIKEERSSISTPIAKMAGCFFGAGVAMIVTWTILGL